VEENSPSGCKALLRAHHFHRTTWKCLVTAHTAAPNAPLREDQEENRVMKGPREPIEHSFGQVTRLWNLSLTGKKLFKLGLGFVVCLVPALAF
jgi:hypothetical protein